MVRRLLNEKNVGDALGCYYAFYHPDNRTKIVTMPASSQTTAGFVTLSHTAFDLFRPLVTLRLPHHLSTNELALEPAVELLKSALVPAQPVILYSPTHYLPLLRALFEIGSEQILQLFQLVPANFEPVINLFVTQTTTPNGLARYLIRHPTHDPKGVILASAGINWQTTTFADISVHTNPQHRRKGYGRSVVSALTEQLLQTGRTPLYVATQTNTPSIELAKTLQFTDTTIRYAFLEAVLRPQNIVKNL